MSISLSGSLVITGSIVASGGITGSFSGSATTSSYALTASFVNPLTQSLSVSGSITATGILTAQTLVVQTVTSSIVYSSGSNIFGNQLTNVQQMTGSLRVTGSGNHYILGGNVGIGTSSPLDTYSGRTVLTVNNNGPYGAFLNFGYNGSLYGFIQQNTDILQIGSQANLPVAFYSNALERMRITASGSVGIGVTPSDVAGIVELALGASASNPKISGIRDGSNAFSLYSYSSGTDLYERRNLDLFFGTNNAYRMKITNAGDLYIYSTTNPVGASSGAGGWAYAAGAYQAIATNAGVSMYLNRIDTDGAILVFRKNGNDVGSISTNANSLPSDLNFKKNINNIELGLNLIEKLRPVSYNLKIDDLDAALSTGFIAQELEQSLTELGVKENEYYILQHTPNKDETQSQYWLDYTKLIPVLVKAIQEQQAQIQSLQEQITELKNR